MTAKAFGFATSACPTASSAGGRAPAQRRRTLAAHELQVLLGGRQSRRPPRRAPAWRPVGPPAVDADACPDDLALAAGTKTCRIDPFRFLRFWVRCVHTDRAAARETAAFITWPRGDFAGRCGTLSWSSPIRSSSSWTWASWKTFSNASTPEDLCARRLCLRSHSGDRVLKCGAVLCGGQQEARPSRGCGRFSSGAKTEKTAMVVGQHPPEGIQEAGACGIAWGRCSRRRRCPEPGFRLVPTAVPRPGTHCKRRRPRLRRRCPPEPGPRHPSGTWVTAAMGPDAYTAAGEDRSASLLASAGRSVPEVRNGNRLRQQASGCGGAVGRPSPRLGTARSIISAKTPLQSLRRWSLHPTCRRVRARRSVTRPSAA